MEVQQKQLNGLRLQVAVALPAARLESPPRRLTKTPKSPTPQGPQPAHKKVLPLAHRQAVKRRSSGAHREHCKGRRSFRLTLATAPQRRQSWGAVATTGAGQAEQGHTAAPASYEQPEASGRKEGPTSEPEAGAAA
ncbi:hypothetical protein TraAM80_08773 [Trypanosoma rangeli]|uniref:Uncharacterized protein n=1 Tax=Trypanosoma rangeli TaxID=5698 RepID=A0A3R7LJK1_TRYRA|nr:uncharacterized protein TraAM80_08773 [Trypanosoma rangeli]RNE98546.1 hypothetical protein TraAM80_08773 [Trypanosoma rangeli]|eukprot:RNE98546.1 hypothetical protein TraAM80_08773 [Trypanosoma rangeli]